MSSQLSSLDGAGARRLLARRSSWRLARTRLGVHDGGGGEDEVEGSGAGEFEGAGNGLGKRMAVAGMGWGSGDGGGWERRMGSHGDF